MDEHGCLIPGCNETVSLTEVALNDSDAFRIYPNPASVMLYLDYRDENSLAAIIEIRSLIGDLVRRTKSFFSSNDQYTLPLYDLVPGTYVIRFLSEEGKLLQSEKLIVGK